MTASVGAYETRGGPTRAFRVSAAHGLAASLALPEMDPNPNAVATHVATFGLRHNRWQCLNCASDLRFCVVGDEGFEPPTSSV